MSTALIPLFYLAAVLGALAVAFHLHPANAHRHHTLEATNTPERDLSADPADCWDCHTRGAGQVVTGRWLADLEALSLTYECDQCGSRWNVWR